jgi:maltose-binding protein MalE
MSVAATIGRAVEILVASAQRNRAAAFDWVAWKRNQLREAERIVQAHPVPKHHKPKAKPSWPFK